MKAATHLLAAFLGLAVGALLLGKSPSARHAAPPPPSHISFTPEGGDDPSVTLDVVGWKRINNNESVIDYKPAPDPDAKTWRVRVTDEEGYYLLRCSLSGPSPRKVRTYYPEPLEPAGSE